MSFNRRRVPLACTFCRHRKRRCDAKRPQCTNCSDAGGDCIYDDLPTQRIDTSSSSREILSRLGDIESLLERHTQTVAALSSEVQSRQSKAEIAAASPLSHSSLPGTTLTSCSNDIDILSTPWHHSNIDIRSADLPPLTIPVKHNTSSSYLLRLPEMKALIGEYPPDLFFLLESRNLLPSELSFEGSFLPLSHVQIDRNNADTYVSAFFAEAYQCHPILDHDTFQEIYSRFLENGIDSSIECALCLVILALGAAVLAPGDLGDPMNPPGMEFMKRAMPTLISLSSWSFSWTILLPQALVLASVYFAYIVRPLQSWRLVYSASTILQFKLSRMSAQDADASSMESILRLFWSCFMVECDRLAELELPQSGLQLLTDQTSLPSCSYIDSMESTCYLAEISIRRLLNRIHNSLYPQNQEISSVQAICDELHRQLDMWYSSIPEPFRPTLGIEAAPNDRETVLRIRYYATKHIIYRPFVLRVTANGGAQMSDSVLEKCQICIESCRLYLHNTTKILKKPSQYTWTFSLSSLGAIVILTLSSLSPSLTHLVPDIAELQSLVIQNIKPWASPNSSLETVISIIQDMQRKQRILACV